MADERLPFVPEPIEALTARFPRALEGEYDPDGIGLGTMVPPYLLRRHVFDFEGGVRLIVSRDRIHGDRGPVLHLSGGVETGTVLYERLRDQEFGPAAFISMCEHLFESVSGGRYKLNFIGLSRPKGIPHWEVSEGD